MNAWIKEWKEITESPWHMTTWIIQFLQVHFYTGICTQIKIVSNKIRPNKYLNELFRENNLIKTLGENYFIKFACLYIDLIFKVTWQIHGNWGQYEFSSA